MWNRITTQTKESGFRTRQLLRLSFSVHFPTCRTFILLFPSLYLVSEKTQSFLQMVFISQLLQFINCISTRILVKYLWNRSRCWLWRVSQENFLRKSSVWQLQDSVSFNVEKFVFLCDKSSNRFPFTAHMSLSNDIFPYLPYTFCRPTCTKVI